MQKPIYLASCIVLSSLSVSSQSEEFSPFYIVASPSTTNFKITEFKGGKNPVGSASGAGFRIGGGVNVRKDSTASLGFEMALATLGSYTVEDADRDVDISINSIQLAAVGQIPVTDIGIGISIRGGINRWTLDAEAEGYSDTDISIGYFYEVGPYYDFGHFNVSLAYTDMIISGSKIAAKRNGLTTNFTYQF